jgi:hypothetical protein
MHVKKPVFVGLDAASSESGDAWEGFLTGLGERGLRCRLPPRRPDQPYRPLPCQVSVLKLETVCAHGIVPAGLTSSSKPRRLLASQV